MSICVVSTGLNAQTKSVCLASVARQRNVGCEVGHAYIEAGDQNPRKGVIENLIGAIAKLPENDVVVFLDGDDWLAHRDVLAGVRKLHDDGAWVTFGSFMTTDGQVVPCHPYVADPRAEPWRASHLRTFRAGLFQRLKPSDLQHNLMWITLGLDQAVMLPIVEMAGLDRTVAVQDVRCVYNTNTAWDSTATPEELARERKSVELIRQKTRYARLESLEGP